VRDESDEAVRDEAARVRRLLNEASDLLGDGQVLIQIWSDPVVERVFVGVEDGDVVVSDNGQTFAEIAGVPAGRDDFLPWSTDLARTAAARFGVDVADEGGEGYEGFRLRRTVTDDTSIAMTVQAVALAIDGTLALHTRENSPTYGSFFWDAPAEDGPSSG
jgi:hypothetical protein